MVGGMEMATVAFPLSKSVKTYQDERQARARAIEVDRLWGVPVPRLRPEAVGVEIVGLGKSYGPRTVLRDLDLAIAPGEFVGVVGQSGSGKSTLLRLLAGLETPDYGQIRIDGAPLNGLNDRARCLVQNPRLLPWRRVYGNVALGLPGRAVHETVMEALARVGLFERAKDWPAALSSGQRQRLALARALVSDPPLLLLDAPLSALDTSTRREILALVERLQAVRGFTTVLVTHDREEAMALCDRVILLEEGRVAAEVAVPLPRPRRPDTSAFTAMKDDLMGRLSSLPVT